MTYVSYSEYSKHRPIKFECIQWLDAEEGEIKEKNVRKAHIEAWSSGANNQILYIS